MKKKIKKIKEKVCEIFKVSKKGKEKTVKKCGIMEKKENKKQVKDENKLLKVILVGLGVIIVLFLIGAVIINSLTHFGYRGLNFNVIKEGELIFYNTAFPMYSDGNRHVADYNFYIRNNPKTLESIPFDGQMILANNMVINITNDFDNCEGDKQGDNVIAMANLLKVGDVFGIDMISDLNANCDPYGEYMFLKIMPGETTNIKQFGISCYLIEVADCEILKGLERFMVEMFVEINERIEQRNKGLTRTIKDGQIIYTS